MRTPVALLAATMLLAAATASAQPCCSLPDNGTGTADLPPSCPPTGYLGTLQVIDGLPAGGTLALEATLSNFVASSVPGGSLGGTIETWTASVTLQVTGGGTLAGFNRVIVMPVTGETHSGPRTPGDAVQTVPIRVTAFDGLLTGDSDFSLLQWERDLNLSPGQTTLSRQGGPGTDFEASSFFDYRYRIQFEGQYESAWLDGYRGITQDLEARFDLCPATASTPGVSSGLRPIARPNPMRSLTHLDIPDDLQAHVVEVFDTRGRLLRRIQPEGTRVIWDGRDVLGVPAPAGVYLLRVRGTRESRSVRVIKLP